MDRTDIIYPNMAHIFSDCPMKFYLKYTEQISYPILDKNFAVGKNIHAMAAYYLKNEDISKLETALTLKEKDFWQYLKANPYFNMKVIGVEKNIIKRLGEYWLGGRLDAIVTSGEDVYILDYKTGGVKPEMTYDFQTMIYCLLCEDLLKEYKTLSFVYLDLKNKQEVKIDFNPKLKQEYEEKLIKVCDDICHFNPKKFQKPKACDCEYDKICE